MFKETAKIMLKALILSIVLAIVFDLFMIFMYMEDMRTQIYMAGHYVETMSADPEALARGEMDHTKLYNNEDIEKEFGKYVQATYSSFPGVGIGGSKGSYMVDVGGVRRINQIEADMDILTYGGVKGVDITLTYVVDPFTGVFFAGKVPGFRLPMKRRFRIVGG